MQSTRNFPDTRWTLLAQLGEPERRGLALEQMCADYRGAVYAYLRQTGRGHEEAEDLTQEFFVMVLRQELFQRADRSSGRLRSWLLAALEHFLANAYRREQRQKRGGGAVHVPLEEAEWMQRAVCRAGSPEEAFDRAWVELLIRQVADSLRAGYEKSGRAALFEAMMPLLMGEGDGLHAEVAAAQGLTVTNFRVQLHRLRGRFRDELRRVVMETTSEAEVQEELNYLFRVAGSGN